MKPPIFAERLSTPRAGRFAAWCFGSATLLAPIGEIAWSLAHDRRPAIQDSLNDIAHRTDELRVAFEDELHDASIVTQAMLPRFQQWSTAFFGASNRKVVGGRDGWLFLRDDLDSALGVSVLAPGRAGPAALVVIADFRDQLEQRGIELLLVPVPGKEVADPGRLSSRSTSITSAPNPGFAELYARLDELRIRHVRVDELLNELRAAHPDTPLFLPQDTHWTPATMEAVARRVAERTIELLGERPEDDGRLKRVPASLRGQGDLVRMLGLAEPERLFPPMELTIERVIDGTTSAPVVPSLDADVLLLGDSFTLVGSDASLGLGAGAGLAEQLAFELKRPLDVIALPGGGATAARAALARSSRRLATKQLVIWQWSLRMLGGAADDWRLVTIPDEEAEEAAAAHATVVGEIVEVTRIPARFDYAFCLATYEYRVLETLDGAVDGDHIWVAFPAIVDRKNTEARSFDVGDRHRLVLEPLRNHYDLDRTAWMDDTGVEGRLWYPVEWRRASEGAEHGRESNR